MPQTYRVIAYITQRVETLVVTDDEDMVSDLAYLNLGEGDFHLQNVDMDILEYDTTDDVNLD